MKRPLTALFCMLVALGLQAQPSYLPLFQQTQWYVGATGILGSDYRWTMMGGDTLIGGQRYERVLDSLTPLPMFAREDTAARQVWLASAWNGYQLRLLYDFGMALGDTVQLEFMQQAPRDFVLTGYQPVLTTMGILDQMVLDAVQAGQPSQVLWGPGIGEAKHPFYLDYTHLSDPNYNLICNYREQVKFFDDGFFACPGASPPLALDAAEADLPFEAGFDAAGMLWMDLRDVQGAVAWTLYDAAARKVGAGEIPGGQASRIAQPLPAGIYVLQVRVARGNFYSKKILHW